MQIPIESILLKYCNHEPSVSVSVVAKHLSLSIGSVYKMAQRGIIPSHKIGKARRFKLSEVESALKNG